MNPRDQKWTIRSIYEDRLMAGCNILTVNASDGNIVETRPDRAQVAPGSL